MKKIFTILISVLMLCGCDKSSTNETVTEDLLNDKRDKIVCNYYINGYEKSMYFFEEEDKLSEIVLVEKFYSNQDKETIEEGINKNIDSISEDSKKYISFEFYHDDLINKNTLVTRYSPIEMPVEDLVKYGLYDLSEFDFYYDVTMENYLKDNKKKVCVKI